MAARYGFIHALYQEVVYERVTAGQRIDLHRRIGEREEHAYGDHAREIAAELAMHFEQGREYRRAVRYRQLAGENALGRAAHVVAIAHLSKGLKLLTTLPDTPERSQRTGFPDDTRFGADWRQGVCGFGNKRRLFSGSESVPADRRGGTTLSGAARPVGVLHRSVRTPDGS